MTYVAWKAVKGRRYAYLIRSIRLPDGKVAKIEKRLLIGDEKKRHSVLVKKYSEYFDKKEAEMAAKWALRNYKEGDIFSTDEIKKIETIRVAYSKLIRKLNKEQLKDVFNRFTANFTYDSNAIEGNSLTLKDVAIVMFDRETVPNKPLREIYETRNSRDVVELIFRKKFKVDHRDIIRMHHMLMRDIDPRKGYTTPPEKVKDEMDNLIEWFNKSDLHPLERTAIFHGRFEKIHPFDDGNGRVGRFLINIILINNGYPPLIVRKTTRNAYMSALMAFDKGYEDKLKRFVLERFKDTYKKFFEVYVKYA